MPSNPTLSGELRDYIADMESSYERDLPPDEAQEHERLERVAKVIVQYVLASRETVTRRTLQEL